MSAVALDRKVMENSNVYIMESAPGPRTIINGKEVHYFGGCAYYGLQSHPEVIEAAVKAVQLYGMSSATSRAGYGNNPLLIDVENKCKDYFHAEDSVYYVSGFLGNSILLSSLADKYDVLFIDSESHSSFSVACSLVDVPVFAFSHLDADDLQKKIKKNSKPGMRPVLITDGVFPVSGEIAPIDSYLAILREYEGFGICVDDAHAAGVIGQKGMGTFEYFGLKNTNGLYSTGTLSKAFGGQGGVISGNADLIAKIKRSPIVGSSSAPSHPVAAATLKGIELLAAHPEWRTALYGNVSRMKNGFRKIGLAVDDTPVPIIRLTFNNKTNPESVQKILFDRGIALTYIPGGTYTNVPANGALRISVFSSHSKEQIDILIDAVGNVIL